MTATLASSLSGLALAVTALIWNYLHGRNHGRGGKP